MRLLLLLFIPLILIAIFITAVQYPECATKYGGTSTIIGFLTVMFAYFYVAITAIMVRNIAKNQEDERRPYIVPHFEFDKNLCNIIIRNIGKMPAIDLKINIKPDIIGFEGKNISKSFFSQPIKYFPPGKAFQTIVDSSFDMFAEGKPEEYEFTLEYKWNSKNKPVRETYNVNIGFNKGRWGIEEKDLNDLVNVLELINQNLSNIR